MLYVGDLMEHTDVGLKSVLGLRSGEVVRFFSTIMLLWAGQLALLIYWYRRKSRYDFHGRYRLWLWIGVTLQLLLAIVATEGHVPFSEYMLRVWPMHVPRYGLLCWLVPVATLSLAIFRMLGMEMRNSPCGRALLWMAGVAGITAVIAFVIEPFLPQRASDLLQIGSSTLAHLGLATALLFHARYVIHVNNEAPPRIKKPTIPQQLQVLLQLLGGAKWAGAVRSRFSRGKLRTLRVRASQRKSSQQPKAQSPESRQGAKSAKRPAAPPSRAAASEKPLTTASPAMSNEKRRVHFPEQPKGPKTPPVPASTETAGRVETLEAAKENLPGGMNKKQLRRLRQLQREANQTVASAQ
jgi:hypothetical protein